MAFSAATRRQVSFHAKWLLHNIPTAGTPLIFTDVVTNQGDAFNKTTGYFTAPYPGTYFFAATSAFLNPSQNAELALYVDNTIIDNLISSDPNSNGDYSTLLGVVHLNIGQRVWIRSDGQQFFFVYSSFSGFLLSHDP